MFKMFFFAAAFIAGGYLALRSPAIADGVNMAAQEFFEIISNLKETVK